ncbi:MAG TPA: LysR family transcriptional regulator [Syntrophobacteraceae bacterium]|nr:LysR family transcriptional regulator [Syntrophobacteraceae bacterium]
MLNFNQLRTFYYAAKSQNFTQAANELYITQPAVTAQIKSLESVCKLTLFRKKGRNLYLTYEGRVLYDHVCKIFEYEKAIEKAIKGMLNLTEGMLRIGTTKTYARFLMPSLISHFHKVHPNIKIVVNEGTSKDMILDLLKFKNDISVVSKVISKKEVSFTPFRREELHLIVSPAHPLAACESISFEQLSREPILMKELGSGTRQAVDELFESMKYIPNILMESGNVELIKQLVMQGEGVSFLVNASVAREIYDGKLATVELRDHRPSIDVYIVYLKNQQLSPPAQALVDMLEQLCTNDAVPPDIGTVVGKILAPKVVK